MNGKESVNTELPAGWLSASLSDVAKARMGPTILAKDLSESGLPVYSAGKANTAWGFTKRDVPVFPNGTIVVSARGSIGFPKIPKEPSFTSTQTTIAITPSPAIGSTYLQRFLQSSDWAEMSSGAAIPMLTISMLGELAVPLAPLAEQKRIADKLEALLGRVDACRARLDHVPALLKRFRQSVLDSATSGRLTAEWRMTNGVDDEWDYLPLGDAVKNHDGKRVPISAEKRKSRRGEIPYYGAAGIIDSIDGFTHNGKFLMIGEDGANLLTRSKPNAFIATGKIWVNNHAHVLSCKHGAPEEFLAHFINSIPLDPYVSGSAQPKLNQMNLNRIVVPQPSIPEQQEIVRRVYALFAMVDRIEAHLATAQKTVERLTPATLAKAFRGELIPQDPKDEPASVLLKRLKNQDPVNESNPKKRAAGKAAAKPAKKEEMKLIEIIVAEFGKRQFSFDELRQKVTDRQYDTLQEQLFELIEIKGKSGITMKFNKSKERMEFKAN